MEGVEEANRAAVLSCKKLVARLSQSGDPIRLAAVAAETEEAVSRFGKVVTILSNRVGHARARLGRSRTSSPSPVDASCLLDYHPVPSAPYRQPPNALHVSSSPVPPAPPPQMPVVVAAPCAAGNGGKIVAPAARPADRDRNMFLETPLLGSSGCTVPSSKAASAQIANSPKVPSAPAANPCTAQIQFHPHLQHLHNQQQTQQQRFQFEQHTPASSEKPSFHIEMPSSAAAAAAASARSGKEPEVITFSFDNSVCTSSAATSFFTNMSSQLISMSDNSVAAPSSRKAPHCARKADDDGKCHCPKKKRPREKRVVRVPAVSDKVSDIPSDSYSWRKYGQKPIKGSPHPRGYYRCSSIKDCPARKHVERCRGDAGMLIVTYENEHNHAQPLDLSMLAANSEA
uniref:Uncharacterized protein n=1 Tax=Avena sativa TaxID=4498 RepID=A0ACD5WFV7_AVESA